MDPTGNHLVPQRLAEERGLYGVPRPVNDDLSLSGCELAQRLNCRTYRRPERLVPLFGQLHEEVEVEIVLPQARPCTPCISLTAPSPMEDNESYHQQATCQ